MKMFMNNQLKMILLMNQFIMMMWVDTYYIASYLLK